MLGLLLVYGSFLVAGFLLVIDSLFYLWITCSMMARFIHMDLLSCVMARFWDMDYFYAKARSLALGYSSDMTRLRSLDFSKSLTRLSSLNYSAILARYEVTDFLRVVARFLYIGFLLGIDSLSTWGLLYGFDSLTKFGFLPVDGLNCFNHTIMIQHTYWIW
jgi:hypothetical protein